MYDGVANHGAKFIPCHRPPAVLVAKLNVAGVTVGHGELRVVLVNQILTDEDDMAFAFQKLFMRNEVSEFTQVR